MIMLRVHSHKLNTNTESYKSFHVDADHGFWNGLDVKNLHLHDLPLAKAIVEFFKSENVASVLELGAGMGIYAKAIQESGILISCYDGNPQTQSLTEGRCGVADFSKSLNFSKHDWILSLEVGEHIPAQYEDVFLNNLKIGNKIGMILSWSVIGQGGTSHVNNRNNSYIREKLNSKGYASDFKAEIRLRNASTFSWLKNTIMVFRKNL